MKTLLINSCQLLLFAAFACNGSSLFAQNNEWTIQKANEWFIKSEWAHGLKAKIHKSVNIQEFAIQYNKNRQVWDKVYQFLKETDLEKLAVGKYPIAGDSAFAMVSENATKDLADVKWEHHEKYIDIQYVIKGEEKMGIAPFFEATAIDPYNETKDIGFYNLPDSSTNYYDATPADILIFFPQDAHRPSLKTKKFDHNKKIVIKVRVK
jgi:YhcH/YjgK/YiaL family protein